MMTALVCIYLIIGVIFAGVIFAFCLYVSAPEIAQDDTGRMESVFETITILCVIAVTWPFWLALICYERFRT